MDYTRQQQLVNQERIGRTGVTLIGCGALGSASAIALAKMGVNEFTLFDSDTVSAENLPNQMYREQDLGQRKVEALANTLHDYNSDALPQLSATRFDDKNVIATPVVVVTTDNMASRKLVWDKFIISPHASCLIEARMGAEEGQVYTITKTSEVTKKDVEFYMGHFYTDDEAVQAPCTAKAVIYNVFIIGSIIARSFKAFTSNEKFPRLIVTSFKFMDKRSMMVVE